MFDYYEFFCPVKIIAGFKALEHIPFELNVLGCSRPLIVTDAGVVKVGLVEKVNKALKAGGVEAAATFDNVPPDSSVTVVSQCADMYRDHNADAIIAIGGGSVIDTAKAVNILVSEGGNDIRVYSGTSVLKRPLKPFFALPTTAGTGSEATLVSVIKDEESGAKIPFVSRFLLPDATILDPRMTLSLPAKFTAATAMDALTHAVESYICLAKNPVSDSYATAAIKKIATHLVPVLRKPDDPSGRLELAQAATMAGIAFSNSMVGLVHALGHSVGAISHVPHGVSMSILLPHVLRFNLSERREAIGELLLPLAGPDVYASTPAGERAEKAIACIEDLRQSIFELSKLPTTLSGTQSVTESDLPNIAKMALDDGAMILNPIDATYEDALGILQKAYK